MRKKRGIGEATRRAHSRYMCMQSVPCPTNLSYIIYTTFLNCGPVPRWLHHMYVTASHQAADIAATAARSGDRMQFLTTAATHRFCLIAQV